MGSLKHMLLVTMFMVTMFMIYPCYAGFFSHVFEDGPYPLNIHNSLHRGKLIVHCKSGDSDLGRQVLYPGQAFHFDIWLRHFKTTLYFCHFYTGYKDMVFDVYDQEEWRFRNRYCYQDWPAGVPPHTTARYYGKNEKVSYEWDLRPDGFYFRCGICNKYRTPLCTWYQHYDWKKEVRFSYRDIVEPTLEDAQSDWWWKQPGKQHASLDQSPKN